MDSPHLFNVYKFYVGTIMTVFLSVPRRLQERKYHTPTLKICKKMKSIDQPHVTATP